MRDKLTHGKVQKNQENVDKVEDQYGHWMKMRLKREIFIKKYSYCRVT